MKRKICKEILFQTKVLMGKREFLIEFCIVLFYVLLTYFYNVKTTMGSDIGDLFAPYEYDALSSWSQYQWYYNLFFPFVVMIGSGFAYFQDMNSGMINIYQSKMGKKRYFIIKSVAIFLAGFLCFVIPFGIGLLLDFITFPNTLGYVNQAAVYSLEYLNFGEGLTGSDFYFSHPWIYHIGMIIQVGSIAGIVSLFVSVFAFFEIKYRILFFLPFYVICYICSMVEQFVGGIPLKMDYYIMSEVGQTKRILFYWVLLGFILLFFSYKVIRKKGKI